MVPDEAIGDAMGSPIANGVCGKGGTRGQDADMLGDANVLGARGDPTSSGLGDVAGTGRELGDNAGKLGDDTG
ncbi:unnamed protein product [Ilex paraguariensis]|uniref:Uncharacterized protein n=1 Tax=Ilex paraguariensis TaxID=185542 RepID=A0ABC8RP73_9AQUA